MLLVLMQPRVYWPRHAGEGNAPSWREREGDMFSSRICVGRGVGELIRRAVVKVSLTL